MYGEFKGVFHPPISGYWNQLIPEKHHCRDTWLRNLFFLFFILGINIYLYQGIGSA
jgi:hypothetical protein